MDIKKLIGARIKELRAKKGFTQEKLAEMMGINSKYMSGIERGNENPTLNTFIKLSDALEIEIGDIFSFLESQDLKKSKQLIRDYIKSASPKEITVLSKIVKSVL